MTIDEVIAQERKIAEIHRYNSCHIDALLFTDDIEEMEEAENRCIKCAEEHEQIVEFLEELKVYQQHEVICHKGYNAGYEKGYADGSLSVTSEIGNKAIDDFVAKLKEHKYTCNFDWEYYDEIAEQMKAGGENE